MRLMERTEGGVTQVEHRVFLGLGAGAGDCRVASHVAPEPAGDAIRKAIGEVPRRRDG